MIHDSAVSPPVRAMFDAPLPPLRMPTDLDPAGTSTQQATQTVAMALVGAAVGAAAALWLFGGGDATGAPTEADLGMGWMVVAGIGLVIVVCLTLAAHEAGHLLGGWLSGFRFRLFVVGPLMLTRTTDGLHAQWHTHWALYGGLALSLPTDLHDLARREARMVAGGPVTSLLLGLAGLGTYIALGGADVGPPGSAPVGWLLTHGALFASAGSLGIGLVTLLPTTTSGFSTDGARLWRYWRDHPAAERDAAVFALTALLFVDRPRDWDPTLVQQATAVDDETLFDVEGRRLAYLYALDTGDLRTAYDALQGALDRHALYPPALQATLTAEAAFFEGAVRGDAAAAQHWLAATGDGAALDEETRLRAAAAVAWAGGGDATEALDRARTALANSTALPLAAAARDWLATLARPAPPTRECEAEADPRTRP